MAFSNIPNIKIVGITAAIPFQEIPIKSQTTSDLAYEAAINLIEKKALNIDEIGFVIFLSKTPDYRTPCTAAVLQGRLNLSQDCIAYDINIGNVGFIVGIQTGASLLNSINKDYGLLLVGDTITKQLKEEDKQGALYKNAASAILLKKENNAHPIHISIKTYSAYIDFFKMTGAFRPGKERCTAKEIGEGELVFDETAYYDHFISVIPEAIGSFTKKCGTKITNYDRYIIHEEDSRFLPEIKRRLHLDTEKILSGFNKYGNTSGSAIPLSIIENHEDDPSGEARILACSYGEGFSLGMIDFYVDYTNIFPAIQTDAFFDDTQTIHEI
jgi:3-oxoacyl-[acyl-carrier-protein] synthase-3